MNAALRSFRLPSDAGPTPIVRRLVGLTGFAAGMGTVGGAAGASGGARLGVDIANGVNDIPGFVPGALQVAAGAFGVGMAITTTIRVWLLGNSLTRLGEAQQRCDTALRSAAPRLEGASYEQFRENILSEARAIRPSTLLSTVENARMAQRSSAQGLE